MTAYLELNDLKLYLGITNGGDDTLLSQSITRAQSLIETRCKRVLYTATDATRYFDALRDISADRLTLYLDTDLCAITSVANGDSTTVTTAEYVTEPRNVTPYYALTLKYSASISWTYDTTPENAITIVGKWAYAPTLPDDIAQLMVRLSTYLYRQKDNSGSNDNNRPVMSPSGVILLPNKLANEYYEITEPYIRMQA